MVTATSLHDKNKISVDDDIRLELIHFSHAAATFELIDQNREHLRQWLPWVDYMISKKHFEAYIDRCEKQHLAGTDLGYIIFYQEAVAGRIGLHNMQPENKTAEIGYWLGASFQKKGIINRSADAVLHLAFRQLNIHRIELKCAVGNTASAAIANRLNFVKEGVLREAQWVNDRFVDIVLFSLLKSEWKNLQHSTAPLAV